MSESVKIWEEASNKKPRIGANIVVTEAVDKAKQGQGEVQMIDFAKSPAANGRWDTIIARPGMVVRRGSVVGEAAMLLAGASGSCIRSDELALALIDAAASGSEDVLLPPMLLRHGRELAAARHPGDK
ncbi:hypothetical protein ACEQ8H_007926 [Pleosporales sp. CAS-2024a]